jgi:CelD/BcsL family acetyltransferase involved in cellulose biosynthesis
VNTDWFVGTLGVLYAGDKLIAGNFGLRTETTMVGWFPAYDLSFARYSPGLIHRLRLCCASAAAGVTLMDLGRGEKAYKDSLKNGELWVAEGRIASASPSAAGHWLAYEPRRRLSNFILSTPVLYRSADRVAKWRGRHSNEGSAPVASGT